MIKRRQTFVAVPAWWPQTQAYHALGAATRALAFELWVSLPDGAERLPDDARHVQCLLCSRDDPRRIRQRLDALVEAGMLARRGEELVLVGRASRRVRTRRKQRTASNVSPMRANVEDSSTNSTTSPDPHTPVVRGTPKGAPTNHPLTSGPIVPHGLDGQGTDTATLEPVNWWEAKG